MSYAPQKEVEHRACLVPWPTGEPEGRYDITLDAADARQMAERFGHEVIDIAYMRSYLYAVAEHLAHEERVEE